MGKRGFVDKHNASGAEKQQKQVDIIEKLGGYDNLVSQGAEGRVAAEESGNSSGSDFF